MNKLNYATYLSDAIDAQRKRDKVYFQYIEIFYNQQCRLFFRFDCIME